MQANEILKDSNIGQNLERSILIIDLLNLNFRKVKINKRKNVSVADEKCLYFSF